MNKTLNSLIPFLGFRPLICYAVEGFGTTSAVTGASPGEAGNDTVAGSTSVAAVASGDDTISADTVVATDTVVAGDDTQPGDDTVPAAEPVSFENLVMPEGFDIPEGEAREGFLALMNDESLSRTELTNKLLTMQAGASAAATEAQTAVFTATQKEWQTALTQLPELGGANLDRSLAEVKQGLEFAGADAAVFDALDITGAGNHPALVPLLHKLVKPFLEGAPTTTNPTEGKLTREQKMFPDHK